MINTTQIITKTTVFQVLSMYSIRKGSGSYHEYERAKRALEAFFEPTPQEYQLVVKWAAEWVGI